MTGVEPAAFRLGGGPSILLRYMDLYKIFSVGRLLQQALRRRTLYPAELQKHMHHMHFAAGRNSYGPQYIITYIGKKIKPQILKFPASTPGL